MFEHARGLVDVAEQLAGDDDVDRREAEEKGEPHGLAIIAVTVPTPLRLTAALGRATMAEPSWSPDELASLPPPEARPQVVASLAASQARSQVVAPLAPSQARPQGLVFSSGALAIHGPGMADG